MISACHTGDFRFSTFFVFILVCTFSLFLLFSSLHFLVLVYVNEYFRFHFR